MFKIQRMFLFYVIFIFALSSCAKEITAYYEPKSNLDKTIIQVLEEDDRFSDFVGIVDKLGLRKSLSESVIYTCLAPNNEQISAYFQKRGYSSIASVPAAELRTFVNYHFINGMYYEYDFSRRYRVASTYLNQSRATWYKTRAEVRSPGKNIKIFTSTFFERQREDFELLYGKNAVDSGFVADGALISKEERDIGASNGVIHILESPLNIMPRTDNALAADKETTLFSSWLERHVQYVLGEKDEFGWVDTTVYKSFNIGRNLADENVISTLTVPTDKAILEYFKPYMSIIDNNIDSVPQRVMYSLIRSSIMENVWYLSDLKRQIPEPRALSGFPQYAQDVTGSIVGSIPASNSVIYKVNRVIESPEMHSVVGGIFMNYRKYSQWYWMFLNAKLAEGLSDHLYYQHPPATILVQPDEVWGFPLAEDMVPDSLTKRYEQTRSGILNIDVRKDGGFRKRFYPTDFGYILYDNNRFYDYTGNSVGLISSQAVWEKSNGAIYEIDGFLKPLNKLDNTVTLFAKIKEDPQLSRFATALTNTGIAAELQLTGFFTYTVFAPTNQALTDAKVDLTKMNSNDLRKFVSTYIIPNRIIFSDGVFNGQINNKAGDFLTISGSWNNFSVTNPEGNTLTPTVSNIQGSNGVIHKVNTLF